MIRIVAGLLLMLISIGAASAQSCGAVPNTLTNGTNADATQVMANFNAVVNCVNNLRAAQLNAVNSWSAGQSSAPVALTFGTTITPNLSNGNIFTVTLTGNTTLANPSNLVAGQCGQIFITQDSTGARTLAYGSEWKFPGGTAPVLTTTAAATDVLSFCSWTSTLISAQLTANLH